MPATPNENIAAYKNAAYPTLTTVAETLDQIISDGLALGTDAADISTVDPQEGVLDGATDVQAALDALADFADTPVDSADVVFDPTAESGVLDGITDVAAALAALSAAVDAL